MKKRSQPPSRRTLGINPDALERLKVRAGQAGSDAVVVLKDGKIIADWTFDKPAGPIEAMSATKSVVNLAIGPDRPEEDQIDRQAGF